MFKNRDLVSTIMEGLAPLVAEQYPITLPNEYRYRHLSLALIDAIYSIGVRYEGVRATVLRYADSQGLAPYHDSFETRPPIADQEPLSHLIQQYESRGIESMMTGVYQNRQRTSSRSGIPKAEAILQAAQLLRTYSVNYFQDIPRVADDKSFESRFRNIPGQGSGISLSYFWMLTGSDDMIKPDRHIMTCLMDVTGLTTLTATETIHLLQDVTARFQTQYPLLTARALDYIIWECMRSGAKLPEAGPRH